MPNEPHQPQIFTDVSTAVLAASPIALGVGALITMANELLSAAEVAEAFVRAAVFLFIPALVAVGTLTGLSVALEALHLRARKPLRWAGIAGLFAVTAATLELASRMVGIDGFWPFALAGAGLCVWVGVRVLDEFLRLDRAEAWLPGLLFGAGVTFWVEETFELRHSVVSDFMDPNAILLTACAGLTILAGFSLAGVVAPERSEDRGLAVSRAVICAICAVALAWGNRVVVVPRLYLEAHLAIAFFEWALWVGAVGWGVLRVDRGRSEKHVLLAWGSLVAVVIAAIAIPSGDGIRPRRLDYVAQGFALSVSWTDFDGDGFILERLGGIDCSESDASVHPFAREEGKDENCTGSVAKRPPRKTGSDAEPLPTAELTVVVTIDTLRPDYVSVYGSELDTTPNLAAIDDWAVFDRAYTSGGITTLAVASLLRGRIPLANDLSPVYRTVDRRYVFPDQMTPGLRVNRVFTVPRQESSPTVAQVFTDGDRVAHAFVDDGASRVFQKGLGYEAGFDRFTFPNAPEGPGEAGWSRVTVTDAVVEAIPDLPDGAFVWLHYYDPHNAKGPCRQFEGMPRIGCYPDAIWDIDHELGRVVEALKEGERWESTLFIVTSDHGEGLGEHGLHHHGLDSYEEFVRIPMLVRGPGVQPGRFETPVSLIDVSATAVLGSGLSLPDSFQGHDLRRLQRGKKRWAPVVSQLLITSVDGRPYRQQTLVVDGDLRHIWDRVTHRSLTFDLSQDPHQRVPIRGEAGAVVRRWIDVLEGGRTDSEGVIFPTTPLER